MIDDHELRAARRARSIAAEAALENPRVGLVDVGWKLREGRPTGAVAVRVHVRNKPTGDAFEQFARAHPDLVVDTSRVPYLTDVIEAAYRLQTFTLTDRLGTRLAPHRPVVGGVSIGNAWSGRYGTLGGVVVETATHKPMALSNWHVLVGSPLARAGLPVYQPAYVDASYRRFPIGKLGRHALLAGYDAALAPLLPGVGWRNEQLGMGPVAGAEEPVLGSRVRKSGRGSGITSGVVDGVGGLFTYPYAGPNRTIRDVCRIVSPDGDGRVSRSGDSGSLWIDRESAVVGLHFAGQAEPSAALAISMPPVLASLGVTVPDSSS
jgi:hypothetical protein